MNEDKRRTDLLSLVHCIYAPSFHYNLHCVSGCKEVPSKYQVYITPGGHPGLCILATVGPDGILQISSQSTHRPSSRQGAYQLFREVSLEKNFLFSKLRITCNAVEE